MPDQNYIKQLESQVEKLEEKCRVIEEKSDILEQAYKLLQNTTGREGHPIKHDDEHFYCPVCFKQVEFKSDGSFMFIIEDAICHCCGWEWHQAV